MCNMVTVVCNVSLTICGVSQVMLVVKNLPESAGCIRNMR